MSTIIKRKRNGVWCSVIILYGVKMCYLGHQGGILSQPEKHKDDQRVTQQREISTFLNLKSTLNMGIPAMYETHKKWCVSVLDQSKD